MIQFINNNIQGTIINYSLSYVSMPWELYLNFCFFAPPSSLQQWKHASAALVCKCSTPTRAKEVQHNNENYSTFVHCSSERDL